MSFLDKLSEKISTGTEKVTEKAKEVSGVATLTAGMEKEKVAIEKLYKEIGKKMYEEHKDVLASALPEETQAIDDSFKKIEDAKVAIRIKKGIKICPNCGKELDKATVFCSACGTKLPEEEKEKAEEEKTEEENTTEE